MECKVCNTSEILKINKENQVEFECESGHRWNEDYIDNAGSHKRPKTYDLTIEDTLFPNEKVLYKKILNEVENNKDLYANSNPDKIIKMITDKMGANEIETCKLFKKIHNYILILHI